MGNFHCIPSTCARVVWREYLSPVVRWRYPGEEWKEIEADYYQIDDQKPQFDYLERKRYKISAKAIVAERVPLNNDFPAVFNKGQIITVFVNNDWAAPIWGINLTTDESGDNINVDLTYTSASGGNLYGGYCKQRTVELVLSTRADRNRSVRIKKNPGSYIEPTIDLEIGLFDFQFIESREVKACLNELPQKCTFTAVLKGALVYEETRDVCPEVEQLPCRLSDVRKSIKIEKQAYLERVEVVDYFYKNYVGLLPLIEGEGAVFQDPIPDECLNIYNNLTTSIVPLFDNGLGTPTSAIQASYNFISQICSAPGCPPPQYNVICDCDELCPPNTCEKICGDYICCYDKNGISQKSTHIGDIPGFLPTNRKDAG